VAILPDRRDTVVACVDNDTGPGVLPRNDLRDFESVLRMVLVYGPNSETAGMVVVPEHEPGSDFDSTIDEDDIELGIRVEAFLTLRARADDLEACQGNSRGPTGRGSGWGLGSICVSQPLAGSTKLSRFDANRATRRIDRSLAGVILKPMLRSADSQSKCNRARKEKGDLEY